MNLIVSRSLRAGLICSLLLAFSARADVVVLKSGDRISGEIQEIWDKDIVIEPDIDDDVNITIPLGEVDYIESERTFDVSMADGSDADIRLVGKGRDGKQLIEIDGQRSAIALDQIEELDEIEDYFDWDSRADFNFALNKGNTDSLNSRLFGETKLKLGDHRHLADLTITREEQDGATTRDSDLARYNYNWLYSDDWFVGGSGSFERDPVRELEYRYIAGAVLGRDIWDKPRRAMNMQAGLGYLTEKLTPTDENGMPLAADTNDSIVLLWGFRYRQDYFGDDLELYHNNTVNWNVTGRSNGVVKTTTGVRYEITDLLYANASVNFDYETRPAGEAENYDLAIVIGAGVEF